MYVCMYADGAEWDSGRWGEGVRVCVRVFECVYVCVSMRVCVRVCVGGTYYRSYVRP